MKYLVKFFVITFFFIVSTHAFAEQKIVVLDMKYVLNNSKAGKDAQEFLKKKFNDNAKKFTELEKSLKKEETDLLVAKVNLTKEEYTKKSDALRKKVIVYQSQRRSSIDKLTTQRLEARKILMKQIEPILDTYIKKNSISIVIDKKNMLGGLTEYDITKIIVEKLDKEFPSLNLQ
jgi:Skp family chaperone for outer membrane proteins